MKPKSILPDTDNRIVLLDPTSNIAKIWEHRVLRKGKTTYSQVKTPFGSTVKATGNISASILFRVFERIDLSCDTLEWSWFVEKIQKTSDLKKKGLDDVAASVFISFGDLGLLRDNPVPTLRYVWANENHVKNSIIVGPYQKQYVRTIIVRSGLVDSYGLVTEQRNLVEDFNIAFDSTPTDGLYAVGIFTDNDDTREPVTAYYGPIILKCDTSNT